MWQFAVPAAMTAIGAGMQALGHKRNPRSIPIERFTPEQKNSLNQFLSQGMANADFGPIEQRARSQFSSQTVPSLAERFTAMGQGARNSSGFMGELGLAASDLESQLAGLRSQYGLNQLQMGLTPQFENYVEAGGPGTMQALGAGLTQAGGSSFAPFMQLYGQQQQQKQQNEQWNKWFQMMKDRPVQQQGYQLGGMPTYGGGF